jgi:rare lipoprotein A
MIDVSKRAAMELGFADQIEANVRVRYLGPAPIAGQGGTPQPQTVSAPVAPAPIYTQAEQAFAGEAPSMQPIPNPVGNYYVQVGSFSEIANAEALYQALGVGMQVEIVPARVNGADYFRVMVGPLETHQTASVLREHLFEQGIADGRIIEK